jgi:hypothetical protein
MAIKQIDLDGVRKYSYTEFRERMKERQARPKRRKRVKFETVLDPGKVELADRISLNIRYSDREFLMQLGEGSTSKGLRIAIDLAKGQLTELSTIVLTSKAIKFTEARK